MKRNNMIIVLFILIFILVGCGKREERDTYVDGSDFQYQYLGNYANNKAKGNNCLYCQFGNFLYQFDEKSGVLSPLCNQANCLHDKETISSRMANCNAFVPNDGTDVGLQYMNGYIYTIMEEWNKDNIDYVLYKIKEDGSSKEKVYNWTDKAIESWCMHRDNAYVLEHYYDGTGKECYQVNEISVDSGKKTKMIFEPDTDISVTGISALKMYGNHLYISILGLTKKDLKNISDEDWYKYEYSKTFQYHILDETISEITVPDQKETEHVTSVTFWKDKIVYAPIDSKYEHQYDKTTNLYIADLDGNNPSVLLNDVPAYQVYSSDGDYLYVSNVAELEDRVFHSEAYKKKLEAGEDYVAKENVAVKIKIYDRDMNLVDEMKTKKMDFPRELPYGIGNRQYVINQDGDKITLKYWDKNNIGTYHGDTFEYTPIAEMK